jgi:anionic cell wall polymer biosynthesis LytR-Cps2A-Psr (LCP) family protein
MRDTWVDLYERGWAKLNAANVYGAEADDAHSHENFGMNISYYA